MSQGSFSSDRCTVKVRRLPHGEDLELPAYASPGSAGCDLRAALEEDLPLQPGGRTMIPTGIALEIPAGWEAQVRPRSGLAKRHGITVLNSPGTIDSDYRGEIAVLLVHLGDEPITLRRGDRIAQLVFARHGVADFVESTDLATSSRGEGGFGSSGVD